jgi:hypothetical protein
VDQIGKFFCPTLYLISNCTLISCRFKRFSPTMSNLVMRYEVLLPGFVVRHKVPHVALLVLSVHVKEFNVSDQIGLEPCLELAPVTF